jgi:hypothetical protein
VFTRDVLVGHIVDVIPRPHKDTSSGALRGVARHALAQLQSARMLTVEFSENVLY